MITPILVPMTVAAAEPAIPVSVAADSVLLPVGLGASYSLVEADNYDGPYEFTPTAETQMVQTAHKVLIDNITINPIPSDWGHISWNGSVLTIS